MRALVEAGEAVRALVREGNVPDGAEPVGCSFRVIAVSGAGCLV